jgi:predicted amidohydrolase
MRVAAIQTTAGPDRQANLDAAGALVEEAAAGGGALVVLPEYFSVAGGPHPSPGVVLADLDWKWQQKIRSELPVLAHRRPEAYRWPREKRRGGTERGS